MKKLLTLALLLKFMGTHAQVGNFASMQSKMDNLLTQTGSPVIPIFDLRYEGVKGSRFLNEEYAEGEIWMTNNRHYTVEMKYKFDEAENGVQVKFASTGKEITLFNNEVEIFKLKLNGSTVTYFKAEVPGENETNKLFQVIYLGKKYQLIKLPVKKLVRHKETGAYQSGANYDKFEESHRYFIKINDQSFKEIKFKKSVILKMIPNKKDSLEKLFDKPQYKDLTDFNIGEILQKIE